MAEPPEMSLPVTRAELRDELREFRKELEKNHPTHEDLRRELSRFATKDDLEIWGGAIRSELRAEIKELDQSLRAEIKELDQSLRAEIKELDQSLRAEMKVLDQSLRAEMKAMARALQAEMARLLRARIEQFQTSIGIFDERYRDLPPRVARVEAKVFPPKRTRRR